ncbi:MAG: queuosine precursor transporter [Gammaproteobacteria bacterium]
MHQHKFVQNPQSLVLRHNFKFYTPIAMLFVTCLLSANIVVQKVVPIGNLFTLTPGDFIFPLVYIMDGILTEVYGYAASRRVIWMALFCNIFLFFVIYFAILLPPVPFWHDQQSFVTVLGRTQQIILASFIAFLFGEFINAYVLAKLKVMWSGKVLWVRVLAALIIGQGLDTLVFSVLAFYGALSWHELFSLMLAVFLFKIFYQVVLLPLIYLIVRFLKKHEGVDIYDRKTNFNPFKLGWS